VNVWDEAGNMSQKKHSGILRIDRLPPTIKNVYSSKLVYKDSADSYTAELHVEQHDKKNHLSELHCSYRINNSEKWQTIPDTLMKQTEKQILEFAMDKDVVGSVSGLRYLEAGCKDWAGNFASGMEIFFVGIPSPIITSPSETWSGSSVIAIRGVAPKLSSDDLPASYMLEWRKNGDVSWQTNGVDIGYGKRHSDSAPYISNSIQSSPGDLGFLDMGNLPTGTYELRLSVRDCDACGWRSDSTAFYYLAPLTTTSKDSLLLAASAKSFDLGKDSILSLSLKIKGSATNTDYRARLYARDSKGALFEIPANSMTVAPYYGKPVEYEKNGVWFWSEKDNVYNLHWKGLPKGRNIALHYEKGDINESICNASCSTKDTLLASDADAFASAQYMGISSPYEVRKPKGLNSAMFFVGDSGTIQFSSQKPLWLQFKDIMDTTMLKDTAFILHLGKGGSSQEFVASFLGGFQVNPSFYGLYYEWNGISSTGNYPQGDTAYFYAEAVENMAGGRVLRDSIKVEIKKPALAINAPELALDDFNVVNDNGNTIILGNKTAYYGISWRDAKVSAYVKKEDGALVKTLFEDQPRAAVHSVNNYMLSWNGIDENGHLVIAAGNYYFEIVATERDASGVPQTSSLRLDFKISFAPGIKYVNDNDDNLNRSSFLSLVYADSIKNDYWRYTPVADYLVRAEASGKTLLDSLRNIKVEWDAKGTQSVQGYPPQRFSLGVKRQRKTLPLVILYKLIAYDAETPLKNACYWTGREDYTRYGKIDGQFTSGNRSMDNIIEYETNSTHGFDERENFYLNIWAVKLNDYNLANYTNAEAAIKAIENETLKTIWSHIVLVPNRSNTNKDIIHAPSADSSCSYPADNIESKPCGFDTENYNPNANLFVLTASPNGKDGYFRTNYEDLYTGITERPCNSYAPTKLSIKLNFTIPDEYWNAGYGYDNLVNRTIRLDQTNETMYGKDGYLRQVKDSTDIKTFFDGNNWNENYTYGMLTPFEEHRFPFVSVDTIFSNNAFTFLDEDRNHKYSSYYHAKFFNTKNKFQAKVEGVRNNKKYSTSLTSDIDSIKTSLLEHGSVNIYVSMNDSASAFNQYKTEIAYPASKDWMDKEDIAKYKCTDYKDGSWLDSAANESNCKKFYENESGVSYGEAIQCDTSFSLNPSSYDSYRKEFYHKTSCIPQVNSNLNIKYIPKIKNISDTSLYRFAGDTLYVGANDWNGVSVLRNLYSAHGWNSYPKPDTSITLQAGKFFKDDWIQEFKLNNVKAFLLDSSNHTHFNAEIINDSTIKLSTKDFLQPRPAELIAIKGLVPDNSTWKLSYLNLNDLHKLASGKSGSLHEWFNVNRLQGNTSILLQWGGDGTMLYIRQLDLDIGASVKSNSNTTVSSLFGEVSVRFPQGSIRDTIVTVRTANAKDYGFETSTGSALLGPVIEVLPSMKFSNADALPRIKARITRNELNDISPNRIRLYKIDTKNGKFVELQKTLIGFVDGKEPACDPMKKSYEECDDYKINWTYLIISAETESFSTFAILDTNVANELNIDPVVEPDSIPSKIICSLPPDTLWLGLDNGWLELPQQCNQPAMGILQLRQGINVIAEVRQNTADTLRWDGRAGVNKIAHGNYSGRYMTIGTTGQEMQTIGPFVYTDILRPVISNWSVQESVQIMDREFRIQATVRDELSGIHTIRLNWSLSEAISGTVYLNADKSGNIDYTLYIPRKQLAQCLGCKLKISLRAEDQGHNWTEQEWQSDRLWPYPTELALWYPALEGSGKTAREYIGTGYDLNLLMPTPWLSASGIYFKDSANNKAIGNGYVDLGRTNSYTLETWIRPGYASGNSAWHRILGFSLSDGKRVDLQIKDGDVRLLDGIQAWVVPKLLPQPKIWNHLAVAVDGDYARFYIDGKPVGTIAAVPSERMWFGNFSMGMDNDFKSFAGHLMQVRFYKKALAEEEVHALFSGAGLGDDGSRIEITLAGKLDWKIDGVGREFSCAVPGSSYWETSKESALSWKALVERAAPYRIFIYARSAQPGNKTVKAGVSGSLISGTVALESVWRSVALQEIILPLKAGFNDIELRFPAGMDIAGIAVSDNSSLLPSQITWNPENGLAKSPTVSAQVTFEGLPDLSTLRPRIRLQNIGNSTIYGPKVRYYFRGEDPVQVQASKFYPQEGTLAVRQESDNLGYAEWSFPETTALPSDQLLFWGEGPHFGLNNANYAPWVMSDDASEIIVLDSENRLLSGSCFENEAPLITTPALQIFARDSRAGDQQASQIYIKLENIGRVSVRDYEVRYSFYVPDGATPILDVYDMQELSASLKDLGMGRWQVVIKGSSSLGPKISWANPAQFALHLPNWQTGWNADDDPSHKDISGEWALANDIEVFDAAGNRIYGKEPSWPSSSSSYSSSSAQLSLNQTNNSEIDIALLPDGIKITMLETSSLGLDLVNAAGMPQKFLYQGSLGAGEHIIPVNWSSIDFAKTYLVVRLNGQITTQLLSKLRN